MKYIRVLYAFMFVCTLPISLSAQRTISGTVTDENNLPLPSATVVIEGTTSGTSTDFDGNYQINVDTGQTLVFSFVGYTPQSIVVSTTSTIDVQLQPEAQLEEVIVTAQGILRQEKALGYAVTSIKSDQLEGKPETDFSKILTGKVTGVRVNHGGGFLGTESNIVIRSVNSLTGSNQPLYIIDGAPVSGSRVLDFDANNIANVSVFKGLSAATLYGEEGRNGVIIITTKTGDRRSSERNKKMEIEVSQTTTFLEIANLPEFQNTYGQGIFGGIDTTILSSFGARFDNQIVPHHLNLPEYMSSFPNFQGATDIYRAYPNNVADFFQTGVGTITSVNLSKNFDRQNAISFAYNKTNQVGYFDENTLEKDNFSFGSRLGLANNFSFSSSVIYNKTINKQPRQDLFNQFLWIPRNLNIFELPFENPSDGSSIYYRPGITNPRWFLKNSQELEDAERIFVRTGLDYDFSDHYRLSYMHSVDYTGELARDYQHKGGPSGDANLNEPGDVDEILGFMNQFNSRRRINTHRLSFHGNNLKLNEHLGLNIVAGFESRNTTGVNSGIRLTNQVTFGFADLDNFSSRRAAPTHDNFSERNVFGVYGQAEFDYKRLLYVTASARNDWASTHSPGIRSLFYPGISASLILTEVFPGLKGEKNNYLKFRGNYGTSARFAAPYLTTESLSSNSVAFINPFNGDVVSANSRSARFPNPDLKPEFLQEFELGLEGRLFGNFLDFNISAYTRLIRDQILSTQMPRSTGYNTRSVNVGRVDSDGIEAAVTLHLVRSDNPNGFSWSMTNNFTAYESTVVELPVEQLNLFGGRSFAIEGEPLGVFMGNYNVKDADGNLLIDPNTGLMIRSNNVGLDNIILGDPNEDFYFTNLNSFRYKGLTLNIQWEYTHGGDLMSDTAAHLLRRGVTRDTEDRERTFIIPGVLGNPDTGEPLLDANGDRIKNNIQVHAQDIFFPSGGTRENIIYDATIFRIRDISLSYTMPKKWLKETPFGSLVFTAQGNNLFYYTPNLPKYMNLDPEVLASGGNSGIGNDGGGNARSRGIDTRNVPSYKQYSFGLKLTF